MPYFSSKRKRNDGTYVGGRRRDVGTHERESYISTEPNKFLTTEYTLFPIFPGQLVHAQLRECLEDTQVKLEHKSQSAARRLLNSAARLAFEFAKPDRSSASSAKPPRKGFSKTTPKAMRRQGSPSNNRKSPLGRSRDRGFRRSRSPPSDRGLTANNTDLGATL